MVSGILMAIFGAVGSLGMYCYISNDGQYTYTGHLTNHELAMIGIFVFKEPATPIRLFFLFTLIASLIGLKVVSY